MSWPPSIAVIKYTKIMLITSTINHIARKKLGIKCTEYVVCDLVHKLSRRGWCNMSRQKMAIEVDMTKPGLIGMVDRLCKKGILKKNKAGNLKTQSIWYDTTIWADSEKEAYFSGKESLPVKESKSVKKVYRVGKESLPKVPKIGKESLPNTRVRDTSIDIREREEEKPKKEGTHNVKNLDSDVVGRDYDEEARQYIIKTVSDTAKFIRDQWAMQYNSALRSANTTPKLEIEKFATWYLDKHFDMLEGSVLLQTVKAKAKRTYRNAFKNSHLPNVRPNKTQSNTSQQTNYKQLA